MPNILETLQDESRFDKIKQGVNNLADTAEELAEEIPQVAESAMRVGYAYAKAEAKSEEALQLSTNAEEEVIDAEFKPSNFSDSNVLEKEYLKNADFWTEETLKARFGSCTAAYQYLKDNYGFKFSRSWDKVTAAFNGQLNEISLEQKVERLEETVKSQQQEIKALKDQLNQVLQLLRLDQK